MSPHEPAVLAANTAFYEAITQRDVEAMDSLWARTAPVACIHPGWDALTSRDKVMASWRAILEGPKPPRLRADRASVKVLGDTAFVICIETLPGARLIATNIFTREENDWRIVHHQAGPVSQQFEIPDAEPPPGLLN